MDLIERIRSKEDIDVLVDEVIKQPKIIDELIHIMQTDKSAFKFNCEKVVRFTSGKKPELIYPHFDTLAKMLDSENSFLKWGSIMTVANMTAVDSDNKFLDVFDKYYGLLNSEKMVAANNVIGSSKVIAKNKPELVDRIVDEILKVDDATYLHKGKISEMCKNIALGEAISFFIEVYEAASKKDEIRNFVNKQENNERPKVVKNVKKFRKKFGE